jgi:hypothetical protein
MADPYKNNVVLYLPMEGSCHGDTVILDRTGKTVTRNGDVILSTTVAPPFGTTSCYFDGTGDYLSLVDSDDWYFGTGDFTIEFWMRSVGTNSQWARIIAQADSAGSLNSDYSWSIGHYNSAGTLNFHYWNGSASVDIISSNVVFDSTWHHVAVTRVGSTILLFVDGIIRGSGTYAGQIYNSTKQLAIGRPGEQNNWYYSGYLKDFRITKGVARYTGNFTSSQTTTVADDYWANVVLAIHGEGTGTTFTDVSNSAKTFTTVGNTTHSTAIAPPFGTSSIYFDGSGDRLDDLSGTNGGFGTGDLTVELWFNRTTTAAGTLVGSRVSSSNDYFSIDIGVGDSVYVYTASSVVGATGVPVNTWVHVAWTRRGGVSYFFLNGILTQTAADTRNYLDGWFGIGALPNNYGGYYTGYIKDLRITKGVARYTQNFNPWRVQDPYYKNTVLLVSGEGSGATFTDGSPTPKTITANGNVTHSSTVAPPFGSTSTYFDGTGDYLSLADHNDFELDSGDFTFEAWTYLTAYSPSYSGNYAASIVAKDKSGGGRAFHFQFWGTSSSWTSLICLLFSNDTTWSTSSASYEFALNTWYHVACVRQAGVVYFYVNGVRIGTPQSAGTNVQDTSTTIYIGANGYSGYEYYFPGYIKDLRSIKGVAKYTTNFTPIKVPAQTKSNGAPIAFADKTAIKTIANSYDWDSPEPVRKIL